MGDRTKRDSSIEFFRVVLMFGLVMLHVIAQGGHCVRGVWDVLRPCLDGFVFISGYYGIRFRFKKCVHLVLIGVWCACVAVGFNFTASFNIIHPLIDGYWFLWTYLALMCFAPLINKAIDADWRLSLPVLALVFGWSYLCQMPVVQNYIPSVEGFGQLTLLTLIGIYLCARVFRILRLDERVPLRFVIPLTLVLLVIATCGVSHYHSVVAVLLAACGFTLFRRFKLPEWFGRAVSVISPSLFSVYLLHQTLGGWNLIGGSMTFLFDNCHWPLVCAWIGSGLFVFCLCLAVDFVRRGLVLFWGRMTGGLFL